MRRWDYRIYEIKEGEHAWEQLREWGDEGWEAVSIYTNKRTMRVTVRDDPEYDRFESVTVQVILLKRPRDT